MDIRLVCDTAVIEIPIMRRAEPTRIMDGPTTRRQPTMGVAVAEVITTRDTTRTHRDTTMPRLATIRGPDITAIRERRIMEAVTGSGFITTITAAIAPADLP
jgi:hypothetical protein